MAHETCPYCGGEGRRPAVRDFARSLMRLRKSAGLGLRELARASGVSPTYVSDIEHARRRPTAETWGKLMAALGEG